MKIDSHAHDRLVQAEARFNRFDDKFKFFLQQLNFFNESTCPLKGVVVETAADFRSVTVKYRTVIVTFNLLFQLNEQNSPSARVEIKLDDPTGRETPQKLGTFTFNHGGVTDFDRDAEGDPIDLGDNAVQIVAHYLTLALRQGAA